MSHSRKQERIIPDFVLSIVRNLLHFSSPPPNKSINVSDVASEGMPLVFSWRLKG
jgi:hypothetical protein